MIWYADLQPLSVKVFRRCFVLAFIFELTFSFNLRIKIVDDTGDTRKIYTGRYSILLIIFRSRHNKSHIIKLSNIKNKKNILKESCFVRVIENCQCRNWFESCFCYVLPMYRSSFAYFHLRNWVNNEWNFFHLKYQTNIFIVNSESKNLRNFNIDSLPQYLVVVYYLPWHKLLV